MRHLIKLIIIGALSVCIVLLLRHYNTNQATANTNAPNQAINPQSTYQKISGKTMGTSYHITLSTNQNNLSTIQSKIDQKLLDINKSMSTYDDSATIMAFNRAPKDTPVVIDDDFVQVLRDSQQIFSASKGAFDPTVKPLVDLWGFGRDLTIERLQSPPTKQEVAAVQQMIGLDKVVLQDNRIHKTADGVGLDFSAIAKGYAVDVIANTLKNDFKITDYMVEIGGEIATFGNNPQGQAWQIAIDKPQTNSTTTNRELLIALPVHSAHLATSGNYRNGLEWQGVRYSHTINPHTFYPVADGAPSVTVVHDSTSLADGWATALTAVPYTDALKLADDNHIAALFVIWHNNDWQMVKSQAFKARFGK